MPKKIMFKDRYGLTDAVLRGEKTMTRRVIPLTDTDKEYIETAFDFDFREAVIIDVYSRFRVGEEVAIAQSYETLANSRYCSELGMMDTPTTFKKEFCGNGWGNKMFVKAEYMPNRIRITNIKVERLQDISEEDCLKEGIQEYFPYIDRNPNDRVRTFQYFRDGKIRHRMSPAPECFALLIDDICGKGTWNRNPWVFAYEFELVR